jgi:site-specific recombinase XerD
MLELGYPSMRRGEEICSLRFEDIQMRPNGKMAILLRRSKTNPLRRASMRQILYCLQDAAGIECENFSSHSFRVGGALDYLQAGMPIEKIMHKGGWHSGSTVIQYLRAWEDL